MRPRSLRDSWHGGKAARWDRESLLLVRLPCSLPNNWDCLLTTQPTAILARFSPVSNCSHGDFYPS